MKRPAWIGARVGMVLTAALIGAGFLGWKLFGLPFAPFDFFDVMARALPGAVVTFGIDSMVRASQALHLASTGGAAKLAEQTLAIGLTFVAGTIVATLAFAVLALSDEAALLFGAVLGAVLGAAALVAANALNRIAPGDQLVSGSWLVAGFLLWGLGLGWANDRLREPAADPGARALDVVSAGRGRRDFLIRFTWGLGAFTVVTAVGGAIAAAVRKTVSGMRWSDANALPNADAPVKAVPGTRPEFTALSDHYRIDADTQPPAIDGRRWRFQIGGLVSAPFALTLDEVRAYEPLHQFITLSCISNPLAGDLIGTTRWTGVSLQRVLPRMGLGPRATHLRIRSADDFWEVVALETIRADDRVMLAYAWDGVPLPVEHGFPLRLYVPNVYGMKQPKWISAIDAIDHWEAGYWVARGWDRDGAMRTTSVIDVIDVRGSTTAAGGAVVTAGGIAHAGARGVSKVEVRVDDGEWQTASLRDPLSATTWVIWRIDVTIPAPIGAAVMNHSYSVTVRCYDGGGVLQPGVLHTRRVQFGG